MENNKELPTYRLEPELLMKGDRIVVMDLLNNELEVTVKKVVRGPGHCSIEYKTKDDKDGMLPDERYITAFMSKYQARKRRRS